MQELLERGAEVCLVAVEVQQQVCLVLHWQQAGWAGVQRWLLCEGGCACRVLAVAVFDTVVLGVAGCTAEDMDSTAVAVGVRGGVAVGTGDAAGSGVGGRCNWSAGGRSVGPGCGDQSVLDGVAEGGCVKQ